MAEQPKSDLRIVDRLDLELFWERHRTKILAGVLVIVAVAAGMFSWQRFTGLRRVRGLERLAAAQDALALAAVAQDYAGTPTAAQALLRLASLHFNEGRYVEAAATYQRFLDQHPQDPFVQSAVLGLAVVKEAQGDYLAARKAYDQLIAGHPNGYTVLAARMGAARCAEALGQLKEARQLYEEVMAQGRRSSWESAAYLRWVVLGRNLPAESTNQPAASVATPPTLTLDNPPAPAPAPAPPSP